MNLWAQHGLACVGFITGAAQQMPSTHGTGVVFGPTSEVKNVFYNGALTHSAQQLYFTSGISLAYLGNVIDESVPPPPPVFGKFEYPRHLTSGVPKGQAFTSVRPSVSLASRQAKPSKSGKANPGDKKKEEGKALEDALREEILHATPGSAEAQALMERLEPAFEVIGKAKESSAVAVAGRFASALWKERQGDVDIT
ncbi:hypothetical protein DL93DRAFT_805642 [Clavulina sp. PMI_390]|nr:hypothetical protein DL93DRAFT_805642 [Clavulina sp. PMI_390]